MLPDIRKWSRVARAFHEHTRLAVQTTERESRQIVRSDECGGCSVRPIKQVHLAVEHGVIAIEGVFRLRSRLPAMTEMDA